MSDTTIKVARNLYTYFSGIDSPEAIEAVFDRDPTIAEVYIDMAEEALHGAFDAQAEALSEGYFEAVDDIETLVEGLLSDATEVEAPGLKLLLDHIRAARMTADQMAKLTATQPQIMAFESLDELFKFLGGLGRPGEQA